MSFLRNNVVVFHAALVVAVFAWLYGGMRGSVLVPVVPWIWALLAEAMLCFPEQRSGESTYQARERVWKSMRRDPLVWVSSAFMVLLAIPFVNNAACPTCDVAKIASGELSAEPYVSFLPYCVNRLHHLTVFLWFVPALTAMVAVKHSLTKDGKRRFLELLVWNAAALAVFGFVQLVAGAPGPLWWDDGVTRVGGGVCFFSTFGYPNAGGSFFASMFAVAVGVWRWRADVINDLMKNDPQFTRHLSKHTLFWFKHYLFIPTVLIFIAALNTLSRAAIMLVTAAAVVLVAHAAICMMHRLRKAAKVKAGAFMALALVIIALVASVFTPQRMRDEISTIGTTEVLDRVSNKTEYHSRVAVDILWDHLLFGCGGWGYAHLSPTKMTEEERKSLKAGTHSGAANVHNDYLQFLAEHGIVGFGCLVAIVVLLLIPVGSTWKRLAKTARFAKGHDRPPSPVSLFSLPAGAFAILVAALVILIHAFGDCPMRSAAVLSLFFTELAAVDGFLPRLESQEDGESES